MSFNVERFGRLLSIAESRGVVDIRYCDDYAEPGYSKDRDGPIVFANWNDKTEWNEENRQSIVIDTAPGRLCKLFEQLGCSVEWSDEWVQCDDCGNAFRISGDCYGWMQYGVTSAEGDVTCGDCIKSDPESYLQELEGECGKADTIGVDFGEAGYVRLNPESLESGVHGGQCDNPEVIGAGLRRLGISRFIFQLDGSGQFDILFGVWVHQEEVNGEEAAIWAMLELKGTAGADPAEAMQSALRDAIKKMGELSGDGIRYAKCKADGTADARMVSPQEFAEGVK